MRGALGGGRREHGLGPVPGGGVGEGLADLLQREARGHELPHAELRHQRERAAERGAAAEGAVDADLAEVRVPEVERQLAALGAYARPAARRPSASPSQRLGDQRGLADGLAHDLGAAALVSAITRSRRFSRVGSTTTRGAQALGDLPALLERDRERTRRAAPRRLASTIVSSPMMPPPITSTVASRGIVEHLEPGEAARGRLGERGGDRVEPRRQGMDARAGQRHALAKPPTRMHLRALADPAHRAVGARAAAVRRLARDGAAEHRLVARRVRPRSPRPSTRGPSPSAASTGTVPGWRGCRCRRCRPRAPRPPPVPGRPPAPAHHRA